MKLGEAKDLHRIPICLCKKGKMTVRPAQQTAHHPGRLYYCCPVKGGRCDAFFWCDDYHKNDPEGTLPDFVTHQEYKHSPSLGCSTSSTQGVSKLNKQIPVNQVRRVISEFEANIAIIFMGLVLVLLGFNVGKIA